MIRPRSYYKGKRAHPLTYLDLGDVFYGDSRIVKISYDKMKIWLDKPVGFGRMPGGWFGIVPAHKGNRHKVVQL